MTERLKKLYRPAYAKKSGRAAPGAFPRLPGGLELPADAGDFNGGGGGASGPARRKKEKWRHPDRATKDEIVRRVGEGESLEEIGRDPRMPERHAILRWRRLDPDFFARLLEANTALADRVFGTLCRRVAGGELPADVCQSPGMPCLDSLRLWMRREPARRVEFIEAREWAADLEFDAMRALEKKVWNGEVPAATAQVAFAQMRWRLARLHPRAFGDRASLELQGPVTVRWADPPAAAAPSEGETEDGEEDGED